jgi:hypothetical protein
MEPVREAEMTNEAMSWLWIGIVVLLGVGLVTGHKVF